MDKLFENFMQKIQQDPEYNQLDELLKGGMPGGAGLEGDGGDQFSEMLLQQFMEKDVLYEPLVSARDELTANLKREDIGADDKAAMVKQLECINELIDTFDHQPENKAKLIQLFERMNEHGSFFDLISKYNPEAKQEKGKLDEMQRMMEMMGQGGENPMGQGEGGEPNCRLI